MNNWRLRKTSFHLCEIIYEEAIHVKSYNIVRELKINATKTIKKVRGIQLSESSKAKSTQYTADSFEILGWLSAWQCEVLPTSNTNVASAHLFRAVCSFWGRFLYNGTVL